MKTRHGFVSNSSSSSFIVVGVQPLEQVTAYIDEPYTVFADGEYEFGWQHEEYSSIASRINFAWIQARDSELQDWQDMLTDLLLEHLGCSCVEVREFGERDIGAYIDHQSSVIEGENIGMFKSKEELAHFLFSPDSLIQCGNDNSY